MKNLGMGMMLIVSLGVGLALSSAPQVFAATVVGAVCDANSKPVKGASLALQGPTGTPIATSVSDAEGHYLLQGIAPGVYRIAEKPPTSSGLKSETVSAAVGHDGLTVDWKVTPARAIATALPGLGKAACVAGAGAVGDADSALETATAVGLAGTLVGGGIAGGILASEGRKKPPPRKGPPPGKGPPPMMSGSQ